VFWFGPLWNKLATQRGTFMTDPDLDPPIQANKRTLLLRL
jgi:hypothetical protein